MGKTTYAAACAVARAAEGSSLLLVSTDPAHSLADALGTRVGARPRRIAVARRRALTGVELDADGALSRWMTERREALTGLLEEATYLDREDVEKLLGPRLPGVDELMGLMELERLARARAYDEVVVDMAPSGHALRLLAMPATLRRAGRALEAMRAKHRYLSQVFGGRRALDAADAIIEELATEGERLERLLRDPERCRFSLVLLAEAMVVEETADDLAALAQAGLTVDELIVNRLRDAPEEPCRSCRARFAYEQGILRRLARRFPGVRLLWAAEKDVEPIGTAALRRLFRELRRYRKTSAEGVTRSTGRSARAKQEGSLRAYERLAADQRRLLLFAGKGGVGKTTAAASAALLYAAESRERRVLLLSVDPAHSLSDVLECPLDDRPRPVPGAARTLLARELDASRGFAELRQRYRSEVEHVFAGLQHRSGLDPSYDREALAKLIELAPPGLDELMGVLSLVDALLGAEASERFDLAVVDAAPTGHALRLLEMPDAALGWVHAMLEILLKYRDVVGLGTAAEQLLDLAQRLRLLIELLSDPVRTAVVIVTRPARLPLEESIRLSRGLARAAVPVGATIVNAMTNGDCSRCRRSIGRERRLLARYLPKASDFGSASPRDQRVIILAPAVYPPPSGVEPLVRWARTWREFEA